MQTVNFQCGHCGNLMAVSTEYLGRQVRCPTCQQVVLAPTSATPAPIPEQVATPEPLPLPDPPAPPPEIQFTGIEQSEDIFHTPSETEDALFATEDEAPRLEMPISHLAPEAPSIPLEPASTPTDHSPGTPPYDLLSPGQPVSGIPMHTENGSGTLPWSPPAHLTEEPGHDVPATLPLTTQSTAQQTAQRIREGESRINLFIPLIFIPLVLYAILATAAAGYLYVLLKAVPPSPFDSMPDIDGDTPGVRKERVKRLQISPKLAMAPLPPHLHVKLGETLRIGDLEVTPKKVERRRIALFAEGAEEKAEPSPTDALVLTLQMKNVSNDYGFTPLDNYFDRNWKPGNDESMPLTMLRAGKETFIGGPAKWFPQRRDPGKRQVREWLEGRKNFDRAGLNPGEEMQTVVATDGWNPAISAFLFGEDEEGNKVRKPYSGKLLWRVQVRRGLIDWKGRRLPATAVIGVEFSNSDYASRAG